MGQSRVSPCEFVEAHALPARGPRSQVPVPGLPGEPVAEQRGQGWNTLPVTYTSEVSPTDIVELPVVRSSVPLAGALQDLIVQVERYTMVGFGVGTGVPKAQPVSVQSGSALSGAGGVDVAPAVQLAPAQSSVKRLVDPSGKEVSG